MKEGNLGAEPRRGPQRGGQPLFLFFLFKKK
jgi:hypothetical protein